MPVALPANQTIPIAVPTDSDLILSVPYYSQHNYVNLCWAACCEMALGFYKVPLPNGLGSITSAVYGPAGGNPANCDNCCYPEDAYPRLSFYCQRWNKAFSPEEIEHEITANRPIHAMIQWEAGNTHLVTVSGCYANGDLFVMDPGPNGGEKRMSYEYLASEYWGQGRWAATYYYIEPLHSPINPPLAFLPNVSNC